MTQSDREIEKVLNNIKLSPRTQQQKQKTLNILRMSVSNRSYRLKPLLLSLTTIVTFGLFFLIWFFPANTQPNTNANPYEALIKNQTISRTYVSKSTGLLSFKPKEYPLLPGVALVEKDKKWNKTVHETITELRILEKAPGGKPNFDLLLVLENKQTIKFKIWTDGDTLVMRELSSEQHFYLPKEMDRSHFQTVLKTLTEAP